MAERTQHVLSAVVPANPQEVRAFYADLDNLKDVHPLVVAVRTVSRVETGHGHTQTYRVTDRIRVSRLTLRTSYTARVSVTDTGEITSEARQFPGVRLRSVVTFDPLNPGTLVTERITIQAPPPLAAFTTRQALAAHRAMLAGIRQHFGG
ncbi:SRPBCC family protein [Mycolicibacterium pulveris]|uniref:Polyketide cyclase / dehydrase and lipid transport n=1 Tax=Mycolicibacterium pulveris TaxID=36813 RepID=A0A7I7UU98_MYCPV|nr:SRPBCC family protein [Mycolicibacterium pulveris]MCV6983774.1 SRPBCC family protein [Mycolicibacterium pulveris]BBY83656.1 hypothetical protein MPUL_48140 [Mycolicibacterium pulveris]